MWFEAEEDLARALAAEGDTWIKRNRETLERAARLVATKLGWVTVRSNVPSATLLVGGRQLGTLASHGLGRARVVAGQTTIELRADGRAPLSKSVLLVPETETTVTMNFPDRDAVPASRVVLSPNGREAGSSSSTQRTVGWAMTGSGVVAIGIGVAFGARAIALKSERDTDCRAGCSQVGVDADRSGRTSGLVSTIAVLSGVAVGGIGAIVVLSAPKRARIAAGVGTVAISGSF